MPNSDNLESELTSLTYEIESLKKVNGKKLLELYKVEKEIKALQEIKVVVTALIKDVEDNNEKYLT